MGELRQEFLKQAISNLEILQKESLADFDKPFSEDFLRRFFRQLHTIKGTSNTFNLINLAKLAHEIESLIQAIQNNQIEQNKQTITALQSSFKHLSNLIHNYQNAQEISLKDDFIEQIKALLPDSKQTDSKDFFDSQIPENLLEKLSINEKDSLFQAIQKGNFFYLLETVFNLLTFYEDFKSFKQILNDNGEVIAVSPNISQKPEQEINFQVFFVSNLDKENLVKLIEDYSVRIEFKSVFPNIDFSDDLAGTIERLITIGEKNAKTLKKNVSFETSLDEVNFPAEKLILLHEIASHLLHNAIDHALESTEHRIGNGKHPIAKIKISIAELENELLFEIEDDGKGLDLEKITHLARQKNLITDNQILNEEEAIKLIFTQGFSTSENVTHISGRGVGLDAVRDLVEKAQGRIEVKTQTGKGTTFSVYLPK